MSDTPETPPKQPYTKPSLVTYGDIVSLTQNRLLGGSRDNSMGLKPRTR